jgi:polar amino acid transport system substrate-binding protein
LAVAGALVVAGCGSDSGDSTSKASGSALDGASTTTVASVPASQLVQPQHLTICSDVPNPPQEFYDDQGTLQGSDIDTGNAIAGRLGLKSVWVNSVFDTIIEAVKAGKCDIIVSGQNITPERLKQVEMIPYFSAAQTFVVKKGNPDGVTNERAKLCGKTIAVQLGALEEQTARGFSGECKAAGEPEIRIIVAQKTSDALQQVQTGRAAAFFQDSPIVAYYVRQQPELFEAAGGLIAPVDEGISIPKDKAQLVAAVRTALKSIQKDGTYKKILEHWNLGDTKVPAID